MFDLKELEESFVRFYGESSRIEVYFAPGRVNLIGEHIDYNGGFVFPGALTLGIYGLIGFNESRTIKMRSLNLEGEIVVELDSTIEYADEDDWGNYPKGIIKQLLAEGKPLRGANILFSSNLPDGAGLSSSAALEVLTAYMLQEGKADTSEDRVHMAKLCQYVENNFIQVNCGIMDQFSVAMGRKDHALLLDCNTLAYQYTPFKLEGMSLIVINTNKRRELADSKYNERRSECEKALALIQKHREIQNLCDAELSDVEKHLQEELLKKRARHVVRENNRVKKAVEVLSEGNIREFGRLMVESHTSLKNDYEVSGKELDAIVEEALKVEGCLGCRMTGAGFGGCAVAIVEDPHIDAFIDQVGCEYSRKTGLKADFYRCSIGDGVRRLT